MNILKGGGGCCHEGQAESSSNQIPLMTRTVVDTPTTETSSSDTDKKVLPVSSDIFLKKISINERSTDTLVPDCDTEERSSRYLEKIQCDPSTNSTNGVTESSSSVEIPSRASKDTSPKLLGEDKNGHTEQSLTICQDSCGLSPNNPSKRHPCSCTQNSSHVSSSIVSNGHHHQQQPPTCCSSDDFSTEDEDGLGNNGLDTAYSSRHYTSSQNSNSQNMLLELEECSLYDSDGLLSHNNGVQRRLVSIFAAHKKQVNHLKRDLYLTRMALCRSKLAHHQQNGNQRTNQGNNSNHCGTFYGGRAACNGNGIPMSNGNGVNGGSHSGGCASSVQSDASSWEAVDEKETKPTLWVPDHAVSSCMR